MFAMFAEWVTVAAVPVLIAAAFAADAVAKRRQLVWGMN